MYIGKRRNEVPPHIFCISDGAYMDMLTSKWKSYFLFLPAPVVGPFAPCQTLVARNKKKKGKPGMTILGMERDLESWLSSHLFPDHKG